MNTASFVSFVIGGLRLFIFSVFEDALLENPDLRPFNSWYMKEGLGILFGCLVMFGLFSGTSDILKKSEYKNVSLGVKIVTSFVMVVGLFGLHGITLVGRNDKSWDFYAEEDVEVEDEEIKV